MEKSRVIATCLVNRGMADQANAENKVRMVFSTKFASHDFSNWNTEISDATAEDIIRYVGHASRFGIEKLIRVLWE